MLVARIEEENQRRCQSLMNGNSSTFEEYKYNTGFVAGLRFAAGLCEGVERDLYGGDTKKR